MLEPGYFLDSRFRGNDVLWGIFLFPFQVHATMDPDAPGYSYGSVVASDTSGLVYSNLALYGFRGQATGRQL